MKANKLVFMYLFFKPSKTIWNCKQKLQHPLSIVIFFYRNSVCFQKGEKFILTE